MFHSKYLWFTDTHLDKVMPWTKYRLIKHLAREKPRGIFLTGDISNGRNTIDDLSLFAKYLDCPIYFVLGNHDYYWSSISQVHERIHSLCHKYPNLIWLTEAGVQRINDEDEVAIIGAEGWYDAEEGCPEYLRFTFDWFMIDDFRDLPTMEDRIVAWRQLAERSATDLADKIEKAIEQGYKSIYLLTHFPPWKEATRDVGTFMEPFWLPYNCNIRLGKAIEKVMETHKKRYLTVLSGHTHCPLSIHVSRNVECMVGRGHYIGISKSDEQVIYI